MLAMAGSRLQGSWTDLRATTAVALDLRKVTRCFVMLAIQTLGTLVLIGCFLADKAGYFRSMAILDLAVLLAGVKSWASQASSWQFVLLGLWNYVIFCCLAGPVLRTAAVEWTTGKRITLKESAEYGRKQLWVFIYAPFLLFLGAATFYVVLALGGLICRIPYLGEILVAIFMPFALLFAFPIVYFGISLVFGAPLQWGAIHTDKSDAFNAVARSIHYLYARPWQFVGHIVAAALYSLRFAIVLLVAGNLLVGVTIMAGWQGIGFISAGSRFDPVAHELWRQTIGLTCPWEPGFIPSQGLAGSPALLHVTAWGVLLVICLFRLALLSAIASHVLSGMVGVYLLLRRSVDGTPFEHIIGLTDDDPYVLDETGTESAQPDEPGSEDGQPETPAEEGET